MEQIPIVIHQKGDSCFGVVVPGLPGCFSAGSTLEEACENVREAIDLHIEGLVEDNNHVVDIVHMDVTLEKAFEEANSSDGIVVIIEHTIKHDISFTC